MKTTAAFVGVLLLNLAFVYAVAEGTFDEWIGLVLVSLAVIWLATAFLRIRSAIENSRWFARLFEAMVCAIGVFFNGWIGYVLLLFYFNLTE